MMTILLIAGLVVLIKVCFDILGYFILLKYAQNKGFWTDGLMLYPKDILSDQDIENAAISILCKIRTWEYCVASKIFRKVLVLFIR